MYILGLNVYHGDSSACLFKDGEMLCAFEEERFTRQKHWAGFPKLSIAQCLIDAGIDFDDIDFITVSRDPKAHFLKKIIHVLKYQLKPGDILHRIQSRKKLNSLEKDFEIAFSKPAAFFKNKIKNIEHHRSHLASTFFASPYNEAAVLTIDAFGDFCSTMLAIGRGNQMEVLEWVPFPHSIGIFYTAFTQYLGFQHYGDEYKVMGLAPYGDAQYVDQMEKILILEEEGLFRLNLDYFTHHKEGIKTEIFENHNPTPSLIYSNKIAQVFGEARKKDEPLTQKHKDIAASVQRHCENAIFHVLKRLHTLTNIDTVCIAGGVAQNSVANGKITTNTQFKKLYIPPAGHDAGTSIGSALFQYNQVLKQPRSEPMYNPYTGSFATDNEIETLLNRANIRYRKLEDDELNDIVTDCLINNGVVGWFNGRAEFGPRALGGRSILADPRNSLAKDLLNSKIKRRESFRPFAPSILKEFVEEYFEIVEDVPFMEKVFPIKPEKYKIIPAVTHVDGTGRLQTVDKKISPKYYGLIEAFNKKTGVPILLNTSFNENEPIVNKPEEALNCFLRTQMDMLVLENYLIAR
jgi:carbamoyltransferase